MQIEYSLNRLKQLASANSMKFSINPSEERDGYHTISVGDYNYHLEYFSEEEFLKAYLYISINLELEKRTLEAQVKIAEQEKQASRAILGAYIRDYKLKAEHAITLSVRVDMQDIVKVLEAVRRDLK